MKRLIALLLAVVMCLSLCACGSKGKLNGTYVDSLGFASYTFKGNKFEMITLGTEEPKTGTYVLEENQIKLTYDDGETYDTFDYDAETDTFSFGGILNFSKVSD